MRDKGTHQLNGCVYRAVCEYQVDEVTVSVLNFYFVAIAKLHTQGEIEYDLIIYFSFVVLSL